METLNLIASFASILSLVISIFTLTKVYQIKNKITIGNDNKINVSGSKGTNVAGRDIKQ